MAIMLLSLFLFQDIRLGEIGKGKPYVLVENKKIFIEGRFFDLEMRPVESTAAFEAEILNVCEFESKIFVTTLEGGASVTVLGRDLAQSARHDGLSAYSPILSDGKIFVADFYRQFYSPGTPLLYRSLEGDDWAIRPPERMVEDRFNFKGCWVIPKGGSLLLFSSSDSSVSVLSETYLNKAALSAAPPERIGISVPGGFKNNGPLKLAKRLVRADEFGKRYRDWFSEKTIVLGVWKSEGSVVFAYGTPTYFGASHIGVLDDNYCVQAPVTVRGMIVGFSGGLAYSIYALDGQLFLKITRTE